MRLSGSAPPSGWKSENDPTAARAALHCHWVALSTPQISFSLEGRKLSHTSFSGGGGVGLRKGKIGDLLPSRVTGGQIRGQGVNKKEP